MARKWTTLQRLSNLAPKILRYLPLAKRQRSLDVWQLGMLSFYLTGCSDLSGVVEGAGGSG
jgi:hypothetical protein